MLIITILLFSYCSNNKNNKENNSNNDTTKKTTENVTDNKEYLIIEGKDIWIRKMPKTGEVIMKLNTGDKCVVLEKGQEQNIRGNIDYWYKIEFNGKQGWVFGSQTSLKSGNKETEAEKNAKLKTTFNEFYELFKASEFDKLKKYFYEGKIVIITNPGAFLVGSFASDLSDMPRMIDYCEFDEIKFEKWPEFEMDDMEGWTKNGCFADNMDDTERFYQVFKDTHEYMQVEFSDSEYANAKKYGKITSKRILITNCFMRFYFTYKNGKWLLTGIDTFDFSA